MAPYVVLDWLADDSPIINMDCLLPTGIIVPLEVDRDSSISEIKGFLWEEAQKYPLYKDLGDKNKYVFQCVTRNASKVELLDETRHLDDYKPFGKFLKVVKKPADKEEKIVNAHITYLIGKGVHEFDAMNQPEVSDFRRKMREECEAIARTRDAKSWTERVQYLFPSELSDEDQFPELIISKLPPDKLLQLYVCVEADKQEGVKYKFHVKCGTQPEEVVKLALQKWHGTNHREHSDDYVLKVEGREEYLLADCPLRRYMFIRKNLMNYDDAPTLILKRREDVLDLGPPDLPPKGPHVTGSTPNKKRHTMIGRKSSPGKCLWEMNNTFRFTIDDVSNYHFNQHCKYQLRCCVFHGPDNMCNVVNSKEYQPKEGLISFHETMEFRDLQLVNIPRMARMCFMFSAAIEKRGKGRHPTGGGVRKLKVDGQEIIPLGWVNIPVFDYKENLRSGKCTLYMWDITEDNMLSEEDHLNPIGTVESNPLVKSSMCLTLTFHNYDVAGPIYFPPFDKVLEVAAKHTHFQKPSDEMDNGDVSSVMGKHFSTIMLDGDKQGHRKHFDELERILKQDALTQMDLQDKDTVWVLRYECWYHYPQALSKLLSSVNWANHVDVAQMQALLQCWKHLKPVEALELLDFAYADKQVRQFAINRLKPISDSELQLYLLQLVQVLKYESYLDCELVIFLLRRALNNQHIGHNLFWLLRSEVGVQPSVAVRFGLILEAYCRGTVNHMTPLVKQVEALDIFYRLAKMAKKSNQKADKAQEEVKSYLKDKDKNLEAFNEIQSPLDPGLGIAKLKQDKLKVMDSKMKPLWLEFDNLDRNGQPIQFMFKKGDDLRQDMLTLQILRIIDKLWKDRDMDLRLTAYGCLATGDKEGLIEIVTEAQTISNIQKAGASGLSSAFNRQSLYKWLKKYNPSQSDMNRALGEFMQSCAGYSVATYVLGVGDRHGDNIMLKKNGQLCHIDYGHVMGNFKSFFFKTITREPAPFQLTYDFVYLLRRGPDNSQKHFEEFKQLCEDAYMVLREERKLLITLFLMMVNTGIPELQSVNAISKHLYKTLVPNLNEKDARKHFQDRFKDSLNKATKVAMYGQVHNWAH